jgi:hypothetical protein
VAVTLSYDDQLGRVRVEADALGVDATYATVDRSYNGGPWATIRGGGAIEVVSEVMQLPADDYEFATGREGLYRVRSYDASDVLQETQTATITATVDTVWLKFVARPYLNRTVTVTDWSDIERVSRNGLFSVVGRPDPIAITDVHSSRSFTLSLLAETLDEADQLDFALSSGLVVLLHCPADCGVPTMYAAIGDYKQARTSRRGVRRRFDIPLTEVAKPGPDVVGSAGTWQLLLDTFATWQEVLDENDSWSDVAQLIGDEADVIVGP